MARSTIITELGLRSLQQSPLSLDAIITCDYLAAFSSKASSASTIMSCVVRRCRTPNIFIRSYCSGSSLTVIGMRSSVVVFFFVATSVLGAFIDRETGALWGADFTVVVSFDSVPPLGVAWPLVEIRPESLGASFFVAIFKSFLIFY
jgi:hypothetical protein